MRSRLLLLVALVAALPAAMGSPVRVYACSAGADWDPVAASDVVIAGYVRDFEVIGKTDGSMPLLTVRVTYEVDRYLKSGGPARISALDEKSVMPPARLVPTSAAWDSLDITLLTMNDLEYHGSSGACGALDADPRGTYWVVGLSRRGDGILLMNRLQNFGMGNGPTDLRVVQGIARAEALLKNAPSPAFTGNAGLLQDDKGSPPPGPLGLVGITVLFLALLVRRFPRRLVRDSRPD